MLLRQHLCLSSYHPTAHPPAEPCPPRRAPMPHIALPQKRPAPGGQQVAGGVMSTAEAYYPNSLTAQLLGPPWRLLLSRIGDTLMLYLLVHASLFARLPNGCALQLTGPPLQQVARRWKAAGGEAAGAGARQPAGPGAQRPLPGAVAGAAAAPGDPRNPPGNAPAPAAGPAAERQGGRALGRGRGAVRAALPSLLTQAPARGTSARRGGGWSAAAGGTHGEPGHAQAARAAGAAAAGAGQEGEASMATTVPVPDPAGSSQAGQERGAATGGAARRQRPSSWQRRRAAAAREAQRAQEQAQAQAQAAQWSNRASGKHSAGRLEIPGSSCGAMLSACTAVALTPAVNVAQQVPQHLRGAFRRCRGHRGGARVGLPGPPTHPAGGGWLGRSSSSSSSSSSRGRSRSRRLPC